MHNTQLVLDLYRTHDQLSVAQIADRIKLSRTTIFKINYTLVNTGLVVQEGKGNSTPSGGKRPNVYTLNKDYGQIMCFHVKYDAIHLRLITMKLDTLMQADEPIPKNADLLTVCNVVHRLYRRILQEMPHIKIISIAAAVHGLVNSKEGICYHSTYFPSWGENAPLGAMIASKLKVSVPIYVNSWIGYKTYAESEIGAFAKQHRGFILIDAGKHGIVSGVFLDNSLYRGANYLSGEIGHMIVDPHDDRVCQCGGTGCLESMISFSRLVEQAYRLRDDYPESTLFSHTEPFTIEQFTSACKDQDPLAHFLMNKIIDWLAIGISNINLIYFPELIILEGDYGKAGPWFEQQLLEKIETVSMVRLKNKLNLVFNEPQAKSTLIGAAAYAVRQHLKRLHLTY